MTQKQRKAAKQSTILMSILGALLFLAGTSAARADDVFALIGEENGNLDRLDITTGTHTVISNNGNFYNGLAFNANETVLYGSVSPFFGAVSSLVIVNPATGGNTPIGSNGVALTTLTNLADGRLFGVGYDDNLYQIDPNTGAATLIGPTGLASLVGVGFDNSLAANGTTLYYTLDLGSGSSLYTLDLTTGAAMVVGLTGAGGILGSAFAGPTFGTGQLYGFDFNGNTDVIDLSTGAATFLNNSGLTDITGGVGIITAAAVPEPSALTMALVSGTMGLLCCVGYRRKRRWGGTSGMSLSPGGR